MGRVREIDDYSLRTHNSNSETKKFGKLISLEPSAIPLNVEE